MTDYELALDVFSHDSYYEKGYRMTVAEAEELLREWSYGEDAHRYDDNDPAAFAEWYNKFAQEQDEEGNA